MTTILTQGDTAFSHFLILDESVSELKIGQKAKNGKKYDLHFNFNNLEIVIELKTVSQPRKINTSYVKSDIKKEFPAQSIPYLLVFSYPSDDDYTQCLENAIVIASAVTHEQFRYYLYRKSEPDA